MEAINAVAVPNLQAKEQSQIPAARSRVSSIHRFLSDQMVPIFIAAVVSVAVYNFSAISESLSPASGIQAIDALQVVYDQIDDLRQETRDTLAELTRLIKSQQQVAQHQAAFVAQDFNAATIKTEAEAPPRLGAADLESTFKMKLFDGMEVSDKYKDLFASYDLKSDPFYVENKEELDLTAVIYEDRMFQASTQDQRMYLQWNEDTKQYSLYSAINMPSGTFLGTFAGVITDVAANIELSWKYRATMNDADGNPIELVIDGADKGNWFHFLSIVDNGNLEAFFIPVNNQWFVGFRTIRAVHAGEELSLNRDDLN